MYKISKYIYVDLTTKILCNISIKKSIKRYVIHSQ